MFGCKKIEHDFVQIQFDESLTNDLIRQVAAISIDMGETLDTNGELTTVGISNVASGLLLGYTGSYIFSQVGSSFHHPSYFLSII